MERCDGVGLTRTAIFSKYAASMQHATVFVTVCLFIESPQCIHDIVEAHRGAWPSSKFRRGLYGAGVRCPRGKNGSFFIEGQVRVMDDIRRVPEGVCRMKQFIETGVFICSVVHVLSPCDRR